MQTSEAPQRSREGTERPQPSDCREYPSFVDTLSTGLVPTRQRPRIQGRFEAGSIVLTVAESTHHLYSVSQLKLYEQCPQRYWYYYVDRLRPTYQLVESFVGARVHESMEYLYLHLKAQELPPVSEVLRFYYKRWEQHWNGTIRIHHQKRGREWYRRYGEKCLRRYYVRHYPFREPGSHIIEVEWPFEIVLDQSGDYRMRGHVDRLNRNDDDSFIVHDYKTSPRIPAKQKLLHDLQPGVYQLAVSKIFPEAKKVMVSWHYLATQKEIRPNLSMHQLDQLQQQLIRQIGKIENDTHFAPQPSRACRTCEYRQVCPARDEVDRILLASSPRDAYVPDGPPLLRQEARPTSATPKQPIAAKKDTPS
ncbi:MAG: PD-(D/E)XK nuclease family protein [Deltaproteobacteria bacterium]|nr:MAG: PD-(D/E)XK nuclease family protein [Deltaproteobacteria bacterium]